MDKPATEWNRWSPLEPTTPWASTTKVVELARRNLDMNKMFTMKSIVVTIAKMSQQGCSTKGVTTQPTPWLCTYYKIKRRSRTKITVYPILCIRRVLRAGFLGCCTYVGLRLFCSPFSGGVVLPSSRQRPFSQKRNPYKPINPKSTNSKTEFLMVRLPSQSMPEGLTDRLP